MAQANRQGQSLSFDLHKKLRFELKIHSTFDARVNDQQQSCE